MRLRWLGRILCLVLLCTSMPPSVAAGAETSAWEVVRQNKTLTSITWGDGRYVAVGSANWVRISQDGIRWTHHELRPTVRLGTVVYGAGRFVGLGNGVVYTSSDGQTWTERFSLEGLRRLWVAGDRYWVATQFRFYSSADAVTWTEARQAPPSELVGETGRYVGLLPREFGNIPAEILHSEDGVNWEEITVGDQIIPSTIAFGNGRFLMGASRSGTKALLLASADGRTWTELPDPGEIGPVFFAGGQFRMKLYGTYPLLRIASSPDGERWTQQPFVPGETSSLLTHAGEFWWQLGNAPLRSKDLQSWTPADEEIRGMLHAAAWGNEHWVVVGQGGTVLTSTDGQHWIRRDVDTDAEFRGVIWANGRFVAWTDPSFRGCDSPCGTLVITSTDGQTWQRKQLDGILRNMVGGNGLFLADDPKDGLSLSRDGLNWEIVDPENKRTRPLQFARGRFWRWGWMFRNDEVLTWSTDGRAWTPHPLPTLKTTDQMVVSEGMFLVYDRFNPSAHVSIDGENWSEGTRSRPYVDSPEALWASDRWYIFSTEGGKGSSFWSSSDGLNWQEAGSYPEGYVRSMAAGDGRLVAVGNDGLILTRSLVVPSPIPAPAPPLSCKSDFRDLASDHTACRAVSQMVERKVIGGYPDGTFGPERPITRAEFAKMLVIAQLWSPYPGAGLPMFKDVKGHWAYDLGFLQTVVAKGVMSGFPGGTLQPDAYVTRAEVVKMTVAASGLRPVGGAGYADVSASDWYDGWVGAARGARLLGPTAPTPLWTEGTFFAGGTPTTRAEAAIILSNLLQH